MGLESQAKLSKVVLTYACAGPIRAICTAGTVIASKTPMIPITTSSSTRVTPHRADILARLRKRG